jgi:hypothetical protein
MQSRDSKQGSDGLLAAVQENVGPPAGVINLVTSHPARRDNVTSGARPPQ